MARRVCAAKMPEQSPISSWMVGLFNQKGRCGVIKTVTQVVDILMCAPDHYDVRYEINPWMAGNIGQVDTSHARVQWQGLFRALTRIPEVRVQLVDGQPEAPDMVFTANAGLVHGTDVVLSRFFYEERQVEEPHFERWFHEHGYRVEVLPPDVPFEGEGDALFDTTPTPTLWCGYGFRSVEEAAYRVRDILNVNVMALELVDPHFYHLDTCFCPLYGGYLMYYPNAFSAAARTVIEAYFPPEKRITVEGDDANTFACNAVNIGKHIVMNDSSKTLDATLRTRGFDVHHTPLSEFIQAGGAAKCLTLFI